MKLSTKLFVMAGLVGTGILVERARQRRTRELERGVGAQTGALGAHVRDAALVGSGIASVDPVPLSTMGEAIDADAVEAAHLGAPTLPKNSP
jgi:hypothetical protein